MKTISVINLKGGVAKTISSANIGYILSQTYSKRVLLMDNDKQGNLSKMYGRHGYGHAGTAEIMTGRRPEPCRVIQNTNYPNLDIVTANMSLLKANLEVLLDTARPQQTRFLRFLNMPEVSENYDYCIIDNAPDINISTINALAASTHVIIPVKIDDFAFDGLSELFEQIENTREELNPGLKFTGCFVTQYVNNDVCSQGEEWLRKNTEYPVFDTHIRRTEKIDESTFARMPISEYSKRCGAARDYQTFVEELLGRI